MSFWIAGATVVGGALAYDAAGDATDAAREGADAATAESARQYDQTRADLASGRNLYNQSNNALARLFGFGTEGSEGYFDEAAYLRDNPDVAADPWASQNAKEHYDRWGRNEGRASPYVGATAPRAAGAPDMSGFFTSPDYNFRRTEGMRGLERTAAARGGAFSGNALRALTQFNSDLASSEYGNYYNRLTTMAGLGSAATNQTAAYGAGHADNASRNALYAGNARASGIENQANIFGQTVNGLAGIYGYNQNGLKPYKITGPASRRM